MRNSLWQVILNSEFIFEDKCWEACKSFCCNWNHPDFNFKIIPRGGTLFYLEDEYDYLSKYAKIPSQSLYTISVDYGNEKPLKIYYKHCQDCDNCNIIFSRSLFCKLYPFLPVFDINGVLLDIKLISVYDITLNITGGNTPCTAIANKEKYLKLWNQKPGLIDILREPYILFHLMAANLLHDNYINILRSKSSLINLKNKDFWQRWEMEYLSGRLIDNQKLSQDITELYSRMKEIYGEFI